MTEGKLIGSTAAYFALGHGENNGKETLSSNGDSVLDIYCDRVAADQEKHDVEEHLGDAGPEYGPYGLSSITLAATPGTFLISIFTYHVSNYSFILIR